MTPQERAEKIVSMIHLWHVIGKGYLDEIVPKISAQIEEAEREAVANYLLQKIGEAKIDPNDPRLAKQMTPEEIAKSDIRFAEGFRAAREKAKGIAEKDGNCGATFPNCDSCDCATEIAQRIERMEP